MWRWLDRGRRDRELNEEIQAHLSMAIRDRVERGEDPREAEMAARREFGNRVLVSERTRDVWGWRWAEEIAQDVRYAVRGMRRSKGATAVILISLGLGIGANTAIFSLVYAVILRSLPVSHPEQLVELLQTYPNEPRSNGYWSQKSYEYYRDHNHVFSSLTATSIDNVARVRAEGSEDQVLVAEYVAENYFEMFGVKPEIGRAIEKERDSAVAMISWTLWNSRFGHDPGVLGKRILVNDQPVSIIGVAGREFRGLRVNAQTDVWLPVKPKAGLSLMARLTPGVTLEQAFAEMNLLYRFTIEERVAGSTDPQLRQLRFELEPGRAGMASVRDRVGRPLSVLMAIVAVLLLLACVNVAGLLLARGATRAREMALRLGLGASRARLMRQVLTESVLLSLIGAAIGGIVAYFGTVTLLKMIDSGRAHERVHLEVQPDGNLLLFAAVIAIGTGLAFGLAPALSAFRRSPIDALRQSGRASVTRLQGLFGRGLVVTQVALSLLLLSCGGLFVTNLATLKGADLGFRRDHVLLVSLNPSRSGYRGEQLSGLYRELLERMRGMPGVRSAALSAPTPLQGAGASGFGTAEGFEERPEDRRWISISWVSPGYFGTLQTPILAGREFSYRDQANSRVAIINQTLAKHYFNGRDPIGKRITLDHVTLTKDPVTYEIVGVAGDANYMEIREAQRRSIYLPAFRERGVASGTFVLRTLVDPESLGGDVRRLVREMAPAVVVSNVTTLSDQIDASIVPERLLATLSGFFAALGALLAGIGVYGLLAFAVTRRTNEIGVRLALGATPSKVQGMVVREALTIVGVGVLCGIPIAWWGRRIATSLIEGLTPDVAVSFGFGGMAIVVVALLGSYGPSRRAARVDPMESLRHE